MTHAPKSHSVSDTSTRAPLHKPVDYSPLEKEIRYFRREIENQISRHVWQELRLMVLAEIYREFGRTAACLWAPAQCVLCLRDIAQTCAGSTSHEQESWFCTYCAQGSTEPGLLSGWKKQHHSCIMCCAVLCSQRFAYDTWDYTMKEEKEGEFLTHVCAWICRYMCTLVYIFKPFNVLLCQKKKSERGIPLSKTWWSCLKCSHSGALSILLGGVNL